MLEHLEKLCNLYGTSGNENAVRDYIEKQIDGKCEYHTDNLGNLIAFKKGKKSSDRKLMIAAHMDEVGLIITHIKSDGTLGFAAVGGIDARVVTGRQVIVGNDKINGVIGLKAVHNLTADERKTVPTMDKLYIDIGAKDKEEAEKYVQLGDCAYFSSCYEEFGEGKITGKALDDRCGCAIMLDLINEDNDFDIYFAFTVQEEIGLRGARAAAFGISPDFAIVLESTTAADVPNVEDSKKVCKVGGGAVVSFMDRSTIYDRELYKLAFGIAEQKGIPCQTKTVIAGGNDSGAIHVSGCGVRTLAISVPCRYLHAPYGVIAKEDVLSCEKLTKEIITGIFNL